MNLLDSYFVDYLSELFPLLRLTDQMFFQLSLWK